MTDVVRSLNLLGCSVVGTLFVVGTVAMILARRNAADRQEKLQRGQNIRLFSEILQADGGHEVRVPCQNVFDAKVETTFLVNSRLAQI